MSHVAPPGSDILTTLIETSCEALETAMLVFSGSDHLVYASRNVQSFYPVPSETVRPGNSLREFLTAVFETGVTRGIPGAVARNFVTEDEWVSARIACMWHERDEVTERLGRERWLSVTTRRLPNGLGMMMLKDISAARKMEDRWRADVDRVAVTEEILDCMPAPLFVLDRNLAFMAVNRAFCKLQGVTQDSILGRNIWDVLDPSLAELHEVDTRAVIEGGQAITSDQQVVGSDRSVKRLRKHSFRIGPPGHHMAVTVLQELTGDAELPMPSRDVEADEQAVPSLDLLDEAGAATETSPMAIQIGGSSAGRVLVLSSDNTFGNALTSALKGLRFDTCRATSRIEAEAILKAAADMGLAVQIVLAEEGDLQSATIGPQATPVMLVNRGRPVHFAVADAAAALARKAASDIMETDAPDAGYMPDFSDVSATTPQPVLGAEVLVAEDNPINQEVYAQVLGGLGISYQLARDGAEAVTLWEKLRPSLVLMDISMPLFDGAQATRRIREIEGSAPMRSHIVGVLPRASEADASACIQAGMNSTIVKPINVEMIEMLYRRYVLASISSDDVRRIG